MTGQKLSIVWCHGLRDFFQVNHARWEARSHRCRVRHARTTEIDLGKVCYSNLGSRHSYERALNHSKNCLLGQAQSRMLTSDRERCTCNRMTKPWENWIHGCCSESFVTLDDEAADRPSGTLELRSKRSSGLQSPRVHPRRCTGSLPRRQVR